MMPLYVTEILGKNDQILREKKKVRIYDLAECFCFVRIFPNKQNLIILLMNCLYWKAYEGTEADGHRKPDLCGHGKSFLIIKQK